MVKDRLIYAFCAAQATGHAAQPDSSRLLVASPYGINLFAAGLSPAADAALIAKVEKINDEIEGKLFDYTQVEASPRYIGRAGDSWFIAYQPDRSKALMQLTDEQLHRFIDDMPDYYDRRTCARSHFLEFERGYSSGLIP